jgi:hypothetical protein
VDVRVRVDEPVGLESNAIVAGIGVSCAWSGWFGVDCVPGAAGLVDGLSGLGKRAKWSEWSAVGDKTCLTRVALFVSD